MTQTIKIEDYKTPGFTPDKLNLCFQIFEDHTLVTSIFEVKKQSKSNKLFLNGENLELIEVQIDNQILNPKDYKLSEQGLTLTIDNESAEIKIINKIFPAKNLALEGLYQSGNILCTQNEPEGFRKITYFFDRSDVLCKFTTTIEADKTKYPYLLANGNKISEGDLPEGRHQVVWEDPFNKATYLFALVAGDLAKVTDTFKTQSGRDVALEFFVDFGNENKCDHAVTSLKKAMVWDEEVYGREYDLDIYMVVAVDSFNMGAMENKGLNIFNSSCVLARPDMATDYDFYRIESVVAHEYFHNWTGNRVTLRNWFELTLKEGLTVFRDQEFSSDVLDRTVQRLQDVKDLKRAQFAEDAGPMSHPIKPKEYQEINNFYTATVYNKGAEVIRMIHTIIGKENFRRGMDLYFERFDGKAVTTEDFVKAMEDGSKTDLTLFRNWYDETGTPIVDVKTNYESSKNEFSVELTQNTRKYLLHIPLGIGLVAKQGEVIFDHDQITNGIFHLKEKSAKLIFSNIEEEPVLSINRSFSSPVYINQELNKHDYKVLAESDSDLFNRAEAFKNLMKKNINTLRFENTSTLFDEVAQIIESSLSQEISENYLSEFLDVPSEAELNQELEVADYLGVHKARELFIKLISEKFKTLFLTKINSLNDQGTDFHITPHAIGRRSLKNKLLGFLCKLEDEQVLDLVLKQLDTATNMTDEYSSLLMLGNFESKKVDQARTSFINKWKDESLVVDKWLSANAVSIQGDTLKRVKELESHELYNKKNPNKFRALIGAFTSNYIYFHREDGEGYKYISSKIIEMDHINPQTAARVLTAFSQVKRLPNELRAKMENELKKILKEAKSNDVKEVASKYLA